MSDTPSADDAANLPLALDWHHDMADVPAGGLDIKRTATEAERAALATALGVLSCDALRIHYRLKRAPAEGYRLRGMVTADMVQACVVTLAPVLETVSAAIDVEFRPAEDQRSADGGNVDLEDATEIEPIDGTTLSVGRVVFEELAAGLNPYPRRPGAEFHPVVEVADASSAAKASPFAVLSNLKTASKEPK